MGIDKTRVIAPERTLETGEFSQEVIESVEEVLQKVEQVIDLGGYDIIKKFFSLNNLSDYFDFYYVKLDDFKSIVSKSDKLVTFYEEKTGESISQISSEGILKFIKFLGINRPSYSEIKKSLKSKLQKIGITYLNEFQTNFKKYFFQDNEFKYLVFRVFNKSISNIGTNDYKILGEKLDLEYLEGDSLKTIIKNRLKLSKIDYLDDLTSLRVIDFRKIVKKDLLIESYFILVGISKSFIKQKDIEDFGVYIGLKKKDFDKKAYISDFLRQYNFSNYTDLKSYGIKDLGSLLWKDEVCREILEGFGLIYLKDFRVEHLKRFARFVGLSGLPKDFELDEQKSKSLMLNILKQNKIDCTYSLQFNGIKGFKRLFKLQKIGNIYNDINTYIKNNIGKTIPNLSFEDLENIGVLLGLPTFEDLEHKKRVDKFLLEKGVWLKDLNKNNFRKDNSFWFNPNLRYFLDKVSGPTDIKLLRPNHIEDMKDYIMSL